MSYTAFAQVYDKLTSEISYQKRAQYFNTLIAQHHAQAGILLDLACGTGSLSVEFAALGYEVIGVDASCEMLNEALQKNAQTGANVLYLCQDMEELDLYGTVDVSICALDSLNHVTDFQKLQRIFQKVSLFTAPDGLFLFDVNTPYKHREVLANNTFVYDMDEVYCVWQNKFTSQENLVEISLDFFEEENGAYYRSTETFCERAYTAEELDILLVNAGLTTLAIYADDSFDAPKEDSQRLIYLTKKK